MCVVKKLKNLESPMPDDSLKKNIANGTTDQGFSALTKVTAFKSQCDQNSNLSACFDNWQFPEALCLETQISMKFIQK